MARRGNKKNVSSKSAEFYKVFFPHLSNNRIRVPPDFVKDFKRTIPEKVILKGVQGKGRHVSVKDTLEGEVFLENEWKSYVDDHSLKIGEFLFFRYVGAYSFVVKIFCTNFCKKKKIGLDNVRVKIEDKSDNEMEVEPTSRKRLKKDQSLIGCNAQASERVDKVKESEKEQNVASECPFFISEIPTSIPQRCRVRIPDELVNGLDLKPETKMMLRNENGKEWPVKVLPNKDARMFGKGWYDFQMDNNVRTKDRCKFTFDNKISGCKTFNVQILGREHDPSPKRTLKRGRGRPKKIVDDDDFWVQVKANSSGTKIDKVPYSDELPEFFICYAADIHSETMSIPPDFIEEFGENGPTICTLEDPSGHSWKVDMKRDDDHWFFQNGWPEFVEKNLLQDRDILTFAYARNSTFYFKVYSCNGCLKMADSFDDEISENLLENEASQQVHAEIPKNIRSKRSTTENLLEIEASQQENSHRRNTRRSTRTTEDLLDIEASQQENPKNRRRITSSTRREKSVNGNPYFERKFKASYKKNSYMPIPRRFWSSHMRKGTGMVTLLIKDQIWKLSLKDTGDRTHLVNYDVKMLAIKNSLKIGTICNFELIDSNKWVFKVTFHR